MAASAGIKRIRKDDESGIAWVKRAECLEKDYRKVHLVIPSYGEDLKDAALTVLSRDGADVNLEDTKLFHVATKQPAGEDPLPADESAALSGLHFPPSRLIDSSVCGTHFLLKRLGGGLLGRAPQAVGSVSSVNGALSYDATVGIDAAVWDSMGPRAQVTAFRASKQRQALAQFKILTELAKLGAAPTVASSLACGVSILRTKLSGDMALGVFDLPRLDGAVLQLPKGFDGIVPRSGSGGASSVPFTPPHLLLQEQRMDYACEFVRSLTSDEDEHNDFGVLLSGPNGCGKSGIGLLAALSSYSQRKLIAYIPNASAWVAAAMNGCGDEFFLTMLWNQNADLIAASNLLRPVFASALRDENIESGMMERLRRVLLPRPGPSIGVIVDEAHRLTEAIAAGPHAAPLPARVAARYFTVGWQNWENSNNCFVRMSIASMHGKREYKLPSGEEHRLRVVYPWTADDIDAAASHSDSPFRIDVPDARECIVHISGGIIRGLIRGKSLLAEHGVDKKGISEVEWKLRETMVDDCTGWLRTIPVQRRAVVFSRILSLVRGQTNWKAVKGLYDEGLVARFDTTDIVRPVSRVAASVLLEVFARTERDDGRQLLSAFAVDERGYQLEGQIIKALGINRMALSACKLDGSSAAKVDALNDFALTFDKDEELRVHSTATVLYVPIDNRYPCDVISIPADPSLPIKLFEVSARDPRDFKRVNKCLKWFAAGDASSGLITRLRKIHPGRTFHCVFCYDGKLDPGRASRYKELDAAAAACGLNAAGVPFVSLFVVSCKGLAELGIS